MSKNNLDDIQVSDANILPKSKIKKELDSEFITIKITPSEKKKLLENAGLVPISKYVKHYLRKHNFFK